MSTPSSVSSTKPTIVLIHGLFLNHDSWDNWIERYESRGFEVRALSYPGLNGTVRELRDDPTPLTKLNMKDVLEALDRDIADLGTAPIIIGHSFGGLFAQLLAYRGRGSAVVGIESSAPAGVLNLPFSTLKATSPVLGNPFNSGGATMLTPEQFHYTFTNSISADDSRKLYDRYAVPCANRLLFEGAFENFVPHSAARVDVSAERPPVLLITGSADHLVTPDYTRANFKLIGASPAITAFKEFDDRPHLTCAVDGWEAVADYALDWALSPSSSRALAAVA